MASRELVIKIPNNYDLSKIQNGSIASKTILNAIANGTPLNEVLDKIRDEIQQVAQEETVVDRAGGEYERIVSTIDLDDVFEILDKYRTESER